MPANTPMPTSQRIVQICLFLFAAIALFGGTLQMYLGKPLTAPRLDNVHRFMAGIYFGSGLICLWAAVTVRQQRTLVLLIGLSVLVAGSGRLLSMSIVGLPEPPALWLGYLVPELVVSCVMIAAQLVTNARVPVHQAA
jgi:TM2 domain-containing membrane protein YozV